LLGYFAGEKTIGDISDAIGISRTTSVRMLGGSMRSQKEIFAVFADNTILADKGPGDLETRPIDSESLLIWAARSLREKTGQHQSRYQVEMASPSFASTPTGASQLTPLAQRALKKP
jgi:hypothetical protein